MKRILSKIKSIPDSVISALVYTGSTLLTRGLAIITLPIFTRMMSTSQIGEVNMFNSWYSLISVVTTLSLTSGGFSVAMKEFEHERKQYISSVLTLTSLIAILIAFAYAISPTFWNSVTGLSTPLMILMLIGFLVAPARDFWLSYARYEYRYKLTGLVSVLSALIASILSVVVILEMSKNPDANLAVGRLISNYSVIFGVAAVIWIYLMISGRTYYNKQYWRLSLQLSLPLVGYSIASQILNVSDRLMIDKYVGKSAVGVYSILYTVSSLSLLAWNAINASFVPYMFQNMEKKQNGIKQTSFILLMLYSVLAIAFVIFAPDIVKVLATEEYYEAIYIMPPIAGGVYLTAVSHMYSNIMVYFKRTKYIMYASIIAAGINVALNAIFIPIYGYMAASYTTLFSYMVLAVMEALYGKFVARKYFGNNCVYCDKKILGLSFTTIFLCLSGLMLYDLSIARYIVGIIFVLICLVIGHYYITNYKKQGDLK